MRTTLMTATIAAFATVVTLNAQAPQGQPQAPRPEPQAQQPERPAPPAASQANQVLSITGCLKEEKNVPGEKPNLAERAGIGNDYILTDVKMASSSQVSGIALQSRYELEGISESDLKKHVNQQVEVTGTITQATPSGNDTTADFRGTSIKMLAATCPAAQ